MQCFETEGLTVLIKIDYSIADIFQSHISHLLCITTPIEVVLLGVTFAGQLLFYPS